MSFLNIIFSLPKFFFNLFLNFLIELRDAFVAPLYFHFGHYSWFINLAVMFSDLCDSQIFFFFSIFFIIGVILMRNENFQIYVKDLFKNYSFYFNTSFLTKDFIFFYFNNIYSFKAFFNVFYDFIKINLKKNHKK